MTIPEQHDSQSRSVGSRAGGAFFRAWIQVFLVAVNVTHISQQEYVWAFVTGVLISVVWLINVRASVRIDTATEAVAYVLGAGLGTVSGMWLGWQ